MNWKTIEDAPAIEYSDGFPHAPKVIVYGPAVGIAFGKVYKSPNGYIVARADGFYGDWQITHWMPLPEPPQ